MIDWFLAKRRRSEESVIIYIIECHGTIIISEKETDFVCDEDEWEVETAEANSGVSVLSRFLTSGTSTATRVELRVDKTIVLILLVMIVMIPICHLKTLKASLSINCKVPRVRILTLELGVRPLC